MARRDLGLTRLGRTAKKLKKIDEKYVSSSYTRGYDFFMDRGEGAWVWDVDGNKFLDFTSGIGVSATGYSNKRVVAAIVEQARRFLHMSGSDFYYEKEIVLARKLASLAPGRKPKSVFFCNSGAEAVEAAIKLSRFATGRQYFIAFLGSFHGRTMGALSLTSSKAVQRAGFGPLMPGVVHVPYGDCGHCAYGLEYGTCGIRCVSYIEDVIFKKNLDPREVAAIFVEPVLGEGGYIFPPPEFLPRLRQLASRHGILLVADEVQSGMGRTGRMFAIEHYNVVPDIIALAKGVASGMPLGAIIAPREIMNWPPGSHGSTFGGNPVSCAAALATIDLLEKRLVRNSERMGAYIMKRLEAIEKESLSIGRLAGKGLMIGMEIVKDRRTMQPAPAVRNAIVNNAFRLGLLLLPCGPTSVRFVPPLIIGKKEADTALEIFEESVRMAERTLMKGKRR
jgi:4-aminobutyrate aminotransferase